MSASVYHRQVVELVVNLVSELSLSRIARINSNIGLLDTGYANQSY